jgi:hypothetical protein
MTTLYRAFVSVLFAACYLGIALSGRAHPQSSDGLPHGDLASYLEPGTTSGRETFLLKPVRENTKQGVDWGHLFEQSFAFLSVEHAFRCATEKETRRNFSGPFFQGYFNAVGNLHGWNDGDPFIVNYVGHPMQGAVSGYLWTHNDRAYRDIQFGQNRRYWKGKLRAAAFSYVYSVLFEIGPISEASIGHTQAEYPQQGFVDHVVTPVIGLGWSITEDALDQYLIRLLEARSRNPWIVLLVRSSLNPSRSMANVLEFKLPWHRDNRPGVFSNELQGSSLIHTFRERNTAYRPVAPPPGVAPFDFNLTTKVKTYLGARHGDPCVGAGGSAGIRIAAQWQFLVDVSGCKLLGLETNLSGDSLTYLAGVRWVPQSSNRWTPHASVLVGGTKLTQELIYPELKKALEAAAKPSDDLNALHAAYSKHSETNGLTIQVGSGLDVRLNSALAFRVAELEYSRSWTQDLNGHAYRNGLQFTGGLILHMGTW